VSDVRTVSPKRRLRRIVAAALVAIAALTAGASAHADDAPTTPEALFQRGAEAVQRGEHGTAIDAFEALADRGFFHPDASYDRGIAYLLRVRAGADRPGDLGRAAAAFEEALLLRPSDHEADAALDRVRAELTRRRARKSRSSMDARPTLDRLVVGLASEQTWGLAALVASLLLAAGLVLRRRPAGRAHVTGSVLAPTAAVALLALVPLTLGARHLRRTARPGVIVVDEVYLADEEGKSRGGDPVPEAAAVEAAERRGGLVYVRWGAMAGWIPLGSVRLIGPDTTR
jgi:hypothetical protein